MKIIGVLFFITIAVPVSGQVLLFEDNFNVANGPLNSSPLDSGRITGLAAAETHLESVKIQQQISGNQLAMQVASGSAVRFGAQTNRYDWAGATTGPSIFEAGGLTVSYDVTFSNTTTNWMAFRFGTPNADSFFTVTDVGYTILMRENGGNEIFNGTQNLGFTGIAFTPSAGTPIPVSITYTFDSIANGSTIGVVAIVNGTTVLDSSFVFKNPTNALYLELVAETSYLIDNFTITTVPEPAVTSALSVAGMGFLAFVRRRRTRA